MRRMTSGSYPALLVLGTASVAHAQDEEGVLRETGELVTSRLTQLYGGLIELLPLLVVAFVIVVVGWWVSGFLARRDWPYSKLTANVFLADILRQVTRLAVFGAAFLLALELLGWTALVGAALGTAGVLGIALGFAFRDLVENYLASILLSLRQPFEPDDLVQIDSHQGRVIRLTSRATILMTLDGNHLRIPNATVFKATILNKTRNPNRRFDFAVDIGTTDPILRARRIGEEQIAGLEGVLADPAVSSVVVELGASTVILRFYGWVDQRTHSSGKVRSEAIRRVKLAFEEAGISMPEPTNRVVLVDADGGALSVSLVGAEGASAAPVPVQTDDGEADDLGADADLDRQVRAARTEGGGSDLLSADAPSEL